MYNICKNYDGEIYIKVILKNKKTEFLLFQDTLKYRYLWSANYNSRSKTSISFKPISKLDLLTPPQFKGSQLQMSVGGSIIGSAHKRK